MVSLQLLQSCILSMLNLTLRAQFTTPLHWFDADVIPLTFTEMEQLKARETKWPLGLKSYKQCSIHCYILES